MGIRNGLVYISIRKPDCIEDGWSAKNVTLFSAKSERDGLKTIERLYRKIGSTRAMALGSVKCGLRANVSDAAVNARESQFDSHRRI